MTPPVIGRAFAAEGGRDLPVPSLVEVGDGERFSLRARTGRSSFLSGRETPTVGFESDYLGPVLRLRRGTSVRPEVTNDIDEPITAHWHGLHVEGRYDGGPQTAFSPGETWRPILDVDQPGATLWYHSHIHGRTGPHVYFGLAGMLQIIDPEAETRLPSTHGVDDLPLIVQDRLFAKDGSLLYAPRGPSLMHGYRGDQILVNGAIRPRASVPAGLVRLRILNASNARTYRFAFEDGRRFYRIASDAGFLPIPMTMSEVELAPAERAEIVVDFADGAATRLVSGRGRRSRDRMMGGMMGMRLPEPDAIDREGRFEIMRFEVDGRPPSAVTKLPERIQGAPSLAGPTGDETRRTFTLDMHAGGMGMRGMRREGRMGMSDRRGGRDMWMGGGMGMMGINGRSMDPDRIDLRARLGEPEIWRVVTDWMAHPFHLHGASFRVLSHNGNPVSPEASGAKDVVHVNGEAEILVTFNRKADEATPYMFHCHILEHEDAGMMGQFTVS
ncbi:MAG: copper oxidase [Alphaproteobacteria bacterium]|nr:copper oxidase [Alphaproteobacteria bacterium]MAS48739.1 copper oxidase [Alphaproteobacteria bacterium]MAX94462.1 copper oxidase [Alphaproteobacteria bacterium]MBN52872.1 copper oxidase [Alphaproteobacteria bacterium]OUT39815.1 MAG: hypothetical protein CBB62_13365 [Micavibrio sp. TMED2]|tara:strand:+ start:1146 stop:2642 length:1497 start_codon:yes stop_codon:yes gene_type:complete